jgi:hypothetical protein
MISQKARQNLEYYNDVPCVRCGSKCLAQLDTQRALQNGTTTNAYVSRCTACGCVFSPDSGMIIELGNLANEGPAIPMVRPSED